MKKYNGIDWLRAFACIGIMMMHNFITSVLVFVGTLAFSLCSQKLINKGMALLKQKNKKSLAS